MALVNRKALAAHDRKCVKIGKQAKKALKQADTWAFDKFNACKTNKCKNKADRMEQKFLDKFQKLSGKQTNCERNRPD